MIDSKIILHDIFYDTSVNFLCTYPFALYCWHVWCYIHRSIHLFTRQMFSVHAVQRYNLPPPYNNIIFLASPQSMLLFMFSDLSSRVCTISRNSPPRTIQRHTSCRNTTCFLFFLQRTHTTPPWFSFGRPMLRMFYFQSTELGRSWTWSAPWNATSCHIFFSRMDN